MEKTKILIHVEGGTVQSVHANKDVQIVIVDVDNLQGGGDPISGILAPDSMCDEFHTLYNNANDPQEVEIKEELKRLKF